jgi:hypothetical protein
MQTPIEIVTICLLKVQPGQGRPLRLYPEWFPPGTVWENEKIVAWRDYFDTACAHALAQKWARRQSDVTDASISCGAVAR